MPRKAQTPSLADANAATGGTAAVDRALSLLGAFRAGDAALSLAELAERTQLYKSTALRLLASLEHAHLLQRLDDGRYALGGEVARLHGIYAASFSLDRVVMPVLRQLVADLGESCNLTALSGAEVVYLDRVASAFPLRLELRPGTRVPIHCSASGKLFLAFLPTRQRNALLDGLTLTRHTATTLTTRAALLTGRNHHSVGVGCLANFDSGYPGYRGKISKEAGTIAEMLRPHGYRNYMLGKWHVTPLTESGATGPFDGWPLGRGFDRYYGFMDAETDQYAPELVRDNTPVDPPGTFATGYHLTSDLVDQGIRYIADHVGDNAETPWLMWLALGACHAPHQAPFDLFQRSAQGRCPPGEKRLQAGQFRLFLGFGGDLWRRGRCRSNRRR